MSPTDLTYSPSSPSESLPVTDDPNTANDLRLDVVSEDKVYPFWWSEFMNIPFDRLLLTRSQRLETAQDFLPGDLFASTQASTSTTTSEPFTVPLGSTDFDSTLDPNPTIDPFVFTFSYDPTLLTTSVNRSLLFSSPGSGSQEPGSQPPADFSLVVLSEAPQNWDSPVPSSTPPSQSSESLGVEPPTQPSGQPIAAAQVPLQVVYSPPTSHSESTLPAYVLVGDPVRTLTVRSG